jgi:hypothetical protein
LDKPLSDDIDFTPQDQIDLIVFYTGAPERAVSGEEIGILGSHVFQLTLLGKRSIVP